MSNNIIKDCIEDFLETKLNTEDIYNEFSLQFELGIFLWKKLNENLKEETYKILFEKNIKKFKPPEDINFIKHEMDLCVENMTTNEKYAIELKFPTNGAHQKRMFQFLEDIQFMEEVKKHLNFTKTYCLTLVNTDQDGELFIGVRRKNSAKKAVYPYFRSAKLFNGNDKEFFAEKEINGCIKNPILDNFPQNNDVEQERELKEPRLVDIKGHYLPIVWKKMPFNFWYYLLEAK